MMLLPEEVAEAATKGELQKVVKWLRKGGHVDARGEQEGARFTLLHWAATFGHLSLAKEVLKRRADVNLLSSGCTPLMAAAFALPPEQDMAGVPASIPGRLAVLRLLLQQNAAVNFQNDSQYTALMSAAEDGNDDCIAILLEAGADTSLRESEGRNALEIAQAHHHDSTAEMLWQHTPSSPAAAVERCGAAGSAAGRAAAAAIAAGMRVAEALPDGTDVAALGLSEPERVLEVMQALNLTDAEIASLSEPMVTPAPPSAMPPAPVYPAVPVDGAPALAITRTAVALAAARLAGQAPPAKPSKLKATCREAEPADASTPDEMLARVRVAQGKFNLDMQRKLQKPQARGASGAGGAGGASGAVTSVEMSAEELSATLKATLDAGGSSMRAEVDGGKVLGHPRATDDTRNDTQALAAMALETLPSSMLYPGGDDQPIPAGEKALQRSVTVTALELAKVLPPESFASVLQIVVELSAISQFDELELDDWGPAVQAVQAAGGRLRRLLRGTHDVLLMQFIDACPLPFRPHLLDDSPMLLKALPAANALFGTLIPPPGGRVGAAELTQTEATAASDAAPGILTAGAVQAMFCGAAASITPRMSPTLQLLDIQHYYDPALSKNLYRLVVSDGQHLMQAVLATKLSATVSQGQARDGPRLLLPP